MATMDRGDGYGVRQIEGRSPGTSLQNYEGADPASSLQTYEGGSSPGTSLQNYEGADPASSLHNYNEAGMADTSMQKYEHSAGDTSLQSYNTNSNSNYGGGAAASNTAMQRHNSQGGNAPSNSAIQKYNDNDNGPDDSNAPDTAMQRYDSQGGKAASNSAIQKYDPNAPIASLRKLETAEVMKIRQDRRGWCQECLCCNHKSDFNYYVNDKKVAKSKEEYSFLCRCCCAPTHQWDMTVLENNNSETELIDIERPFRFPMGPCKCCCFQEAAISSGDDDLGEVRETFWCCVPQFKVYDDDDETVYIVHPPTCCGGACVDCCNEGNCCPHGCHLIPWRVYPADAVSTSGDAPWVGRMAKIPKDTFNDVFDHMQTYELEFPETANKEKKGLLLGTSLLINSLFFEGSE